MDALSHALRMGFRSLSRRPGFSLVVMSTLALGIGANTTMYGIVDRVLLSPPAHVLEPEQVRRLYITRRLGAEPFTTTSVAYTDFEAFAAVDGFVDTAAYSFAQQGTLVSGEATHRIREVFASGGFFDLLGVQPAAGRLFGPQDDAAGSAEVVVLGYRIWQDLFAGDESIIGRTVRIADAPMTVIGVAPQGFTGVELQRVDAWMPLRASLTGGEAQWRRGGWYWLAVVARVAPGSTPEALASAATAAHRAGRAEDARYDPEATVAAASIIAARGPRASNESRVAIWLSGVSLLVLLVACANVANLLLARGIQRRAETALRLALGISRRRLLGELAAETLLLALGGGFVALLIATRGGGAARAALFPDIEWLSGGIDAHMISFTLTVAVVSGLAAALLPGLQHRSNDLRTSFASTAGPGRGRLRNALMVLQCALSVVLLVGAGLFVRSLQQVLDVDLGMATDNVLLVEPDIVYEDLDEVRLSDLFERARERLESLPAVRRAAYVGGSVPFLLSFVTRIAVPGVDDIPSLPGGGPYYYQVSEEYFDAAGMDIVRGRGFTSADGPGAPPVVVINETMAGALWPDGDAVGECIRIGADDPPCSEVVGVVRDVRRSYLDPPTMLYYLPWRQRLLEGAPRALLLAIEDADLAPLVAAARAEITALEPAIDWVETRSLRDVIDPQARSWRLGATMFTAFGVLALAVASIGLYGILSFELAQRRREIGVRAALGAAPATLARMMIGRGLAPAVGGIVIGLMTTATLGRWIEPLLYAVSPHDPMVLATVTGGLLIAAVLAAALPARRATRVDPMHELRTGR